MYKRQISIDSIKTTERLLDKLDLSTEDELLLQQALKEDEERRKQQQQQGQQKPVLCMPASGFPSLRNTSGSSQHRRIASAGSSKALIDELADNEKIVSSKAPEIEQHFSRYRYSYLVEEESDEDCNSPTDSGTSGNSTVNIEMYRLKNSKYNGCLLYTSPASLSAALHDLFFFFFFLYLLVFCKLLV